MADCLQMLLRFVACDWLHFQTPALVHFFNMRVLTCSEEVYRDCVTAHRLTASKTTAVCYCLLFLCYLKCH